MARPSEFKRIENGIFLGRFAGGEKIYRVEVSVRATENGFSKRLYRHGTAKTQREARKLRDEFRAALGQRVKEGPALLLKDLIDPFLRERQQSLRASSYYRLVSLLQAHVLPALGHVRVKDISTADIDNCLRIEGDGKSGQTVRHLFNCLRAILQMALRRGIVKTNACEAAERPKIKRRDALVLSKEQARQLIDHLREHHRMLYIHVALALYTAARAGELRALRWSDIDFNRNLISISKTLDTKTKQKSGTKNLQNRLVPINSELLQLLQELRRETFSAPTDFVLPHWREFQAGEQGKPLKIVLEALGLPLIRFHDLRATAITLLLTENVPVTKVMKIAGHMRLSSTSIYTRLAGVEVAGATEKLRLFD